MSRVVVSKRRLAYRAVAPAVAWAACAGLAALPSTVEAAAGGGFSGPTEATGMSMLWNPAALTGRPPGWTTLVEVSGNYLGVDFQRAGSSPYDGQAFEPVSFSAFVPDAGFLVASPTPWPWLRVIAGGFSPSTLGGRWPEDGPQRFWGTNSQIVTYAVAAGVLIQPHPNYGVAFSAGPVYGTLELNYSIDFGSFANGMLPAGAALFPLEDPQLEGRTRVTGTGWTSVAVGGAWARPVPWLVLGAGVFVPRGLITQGTMEVEASEALERSLPGFNLRPTGNIEVRYPLPWNLSLEATTYFGPWSVAGNFQYTRKSVQRILVATVTESDPDFIEGRQVSVKNTQDDWLIGVRGTRRLGADWELVLRFDYDPRYIPKETITTNNVDFTSLESSVGARWQVSSSMRVSLTYKFYKLFPFTVSNSLYSPYAPSESGLGSPAANGTYGAWAHGLTLSFEGVWAGDG